MDPSCSMYVFLKNSFGKDLCHYTPFFYEENQFTAFGGHNLLIYT